MTSAHIWTTDRFKSVRGTLTSWTVWSLELPSPWRNVSISFVTGDGTVLLCSLRNPLSLEILLTEVRDNFNLFLLPISKFDFSNSVNVYYKLVQTFTATCETWSLSLVKRCTFPWFVCFFRRNQGSCIRSFHFLSWCRICCDALMQRGKTGAKMWLWPELQWNVWRGIQVGGV